MINHPIPQLSADGLEGWIACARHYLGQHERGTTSEIVMALMRQSAEIAEGLLGKATAQAEDSQDSQESRKGEGDTGRNPPVSRDTPPPSTPTVRAANGRRGEVFTEERVRLLRRLYPTAMTVENIWHHLNALPGTPVGSTGSLMAKAKVVGARRQNLPIPPEFLQAGAPPPAPAAPQPDQRYSGAPRTRDADPSADTAMNTEDLHEAREQLRTGKAKGARDIFEWFGCAPEEAQRIVDEFRASAASRAA